MLVKPLPEDFRGVFRKVASSFPLVVSHGRTVGVESAGVESIFFRGSKNTIGATVPILTF